MHKKIMIRYSFIILVMVLIGIAIIFKAGIIMFAERQYWNDVADRFIKENVTVKPTRGNIISADGQLMASSLPEYKIYMDFKAGGEIKDFLVRRRMCEANMYLNGVYSQTPPENYCFVKYDANGGTTNPRSQGYDALLTAQPFPVPTYEGYTFDGWYKEKECINKWDFTTNKTGDELIIEEEDQYNEYLGIYLYAKWIKR